MKWRAGQSAPELDIIESMERMRMTSPASSLSKVDRFVHPLRLEARTSRNRAYAPSI
jgi:hypothetical protein